MEPRKLLCSCIYCKEVRSAKGIHTHVERTHLGSTKYSSGYNGKYNDPAHRAKLKKAVNAADNIKLGFLKEFTVVCNKCSKEFSVAEREKQFPSKEKYFCSGSCANSHVVNDNTRKKISSTLTGRVYVDPYNAVKLCENCNTEFSFVKHYTKSEKRFCTKSCVMDNLSKSATIRNEIARKNRPALTNYRADCAFKFALNDYPAEFDFSLINEHGWYKPKNHGNNLTGVSRDHMVSVRYGFDNNLPAKHLSHPANCMLLQHGENSSKGKSISLTYEQLLVKIVEWDNKYKIILP